MPDVRPTDRPLTARSVIASTLLGVDPPRLPAQALARSGELFGLREGTTRTALSRMVAAGELVSGEGWYELAGPLRARHRRQQVARATPPVADWDGTWELALVVGDRRSAADRAALRTAAGRLRLAEVREGCWARPSNLDPGRASDDRVIVASQCTIVRGAVPDDVDVFVAAFDLATWSERATELTAALQAGQPALDERRTDALPDAFVLDAAVLRHLVADPTLPPALLPAAWPAPALRSAFDAFDAAFKATWREWHRAFRDRT